MAPVYAMVIPTEKVGLVRLTFQDDGALARISLRAEAVLGASSGESGSRPSKAPSVAAVRRWLQDYMVGAAGDFPGPWSNPGRTDFAQRVYAVVAAVPAGKTMRQPPDRARRSQRDGRSLRPPDLLGQVVLLAQPWGVIPFPWWCPDTAFWRSAVSWADLRAAPTSKWPCLPSRGRTSALQKLPSVKEH